MRCFIACMAVCATAGLAAADAIEISGIGGGLTLHSKDLSGIAFTTTSPTFSTSDLEAIHDDINADIMTDGCVSFILAHVDVGGTTKLAFMALVDDQTSGTFTAFTTSLGMTTTGNGTNLECINDSVCDITCSLVSTFDGDFNLELRTHCDAFAWSNLVAGDVLNFRFEENFAANGDLPTTAGLSYPPFQFLSWDGSAWVRVSGAGAGAGGKYDFTVNDQFGFSATVIPLPMPALLGIAGLGLAHIARRRSLKR